MHIISLIPFLWVIKPYRPIVKIMDESSMLSSNGIIGVTPSLSSFFLPPL
jgi:hypothetical protein